MEQTLAALPAVALAVPFWGAKESLPPETREFMLRTGREAGRRIREQARAEDEAAIAAMREKQSLVVTPLPPAAEAEWRAAVEKLYPRIRGEVVPAATFDAAAAALDDYRRSAGRSPARAAR